MAGCYRLLLLIVLLGVAGPLNAATYVVSNLNDDGDGSLRQAVVSANANAEANEIDFSVSGVIVLLSGLPAIAGDLTLQGSGQTVSISGNNAAIHLVSVNAGATLSVANLTLEHAGVGVDNHGALSLSHVLVQYMTRIEGFAATGAGISNGGTGAVTIADSHFDRNEIQLAPGGALYNCADCTATITNSAFTFNRAKFSDDSHGGAIYNRGVLSISGSTFASNYAQGLGGAMFTFIPGSTTVDHSTFQSNESVTDGGAIASARNSSLTVSASTFENNTAPYGGAIHAPGAISVSTSTFSGNVGSSERLASGIDVGDGQLTNLTFGGNGVFSTGTTTINNSTFVYGSSASTYFGGTLALQNSVLALNGTSCSGSVTADSTTFVDEASCSGATQVTTAAISLAADLVINGGPTKTYALIAGSVAIDAGNPATCATTDQRGIARPQGAVCDSGAFEFVDHIFGDDFEGTEP